MDKMKIKKTVSILLTTAVAATMIPGCSKEDDGAVKFSEKYMDSVLSADFNGMTDMLREDDGIADYSIDDRSFTGLVAVLGHCDYEQKEYRGDKDEITIEYTLRLPDLEDIKGNEYGSYADLLTSLDDLDEREFDIEISLVPKGDKWLVKDAGSTLELYEDILDGLSEAEFEYSLGYEGVLASLEEHLPGLAEEFISSTPVAGEYNITYDGLQFVFSRFDDSDYAFEMFSVIVGCWLDEVPTEDDHYYYLNAQGRASGIVWKDEMVVHIYDQDGTHYDEVNSVLEDLQEML